MRRWGIVAAMVLVVFGMVGYYAMTSMHTKISEQAGGRVLHIGDTDVEVTMADTEAAREQGLSGTAPLTEGHGMLFLFDTPGHYGFWMKDMNYALDIIFIDASWQVVNISADLTPATYPNAYYPTSPAQYVLEVPAGFAAEHGIAEGTKVVLQ